MPEISDHFTHRDRNRAERTTELYDSLARESLDLTGDPLERRRLLDEVVLVNLPVADAVARRYAGRGTTAEDLQQVARLALVRAAASFRPALGHDFLSYAVPSIRGEVRRYFRDHAWMVRPPRRVQEAQLRMTSWRETFLQERGREPGPSDYASGLGLDVDTVREALTVNDCYHPDSLEQPLGDGDPGQQTLADRVGAHEPGFDLSEARTVLAPALAALAPRDRTVLRLRYVEGLTQREVGEHIGVTQMQVSRILQRVLDELRTRLGALEAA